MINLICFAHIHFRYSFYGNSISATIAPASWLMAHGSILKAKAELHSAAVDDENQVSFDESPTRSKKRMMKAVTKY